MRVLHVYSGNLYGGIETFLSMLGRTQASGEAIEHQFALCFKGRLSKELDFAHATVHWLGEVHARQPWTVWRGRRKLARILGDESFDAVICHSSWPLAIFGPVVRRAELPLIFYLHGPIERAGWVDRWASHTPPDRLIAVSEHTLHSGRKLFANVDAEVLNYPLPWPMERFDGSSRQPMRFALGISPQDVLIIQVSRMDAWKGHMQSLEALAKLRQVPNWRCCIVGGAQRASEARYVEQLKRRVSDLKLDSRMQFLGERKDLPQLLSAADIFLQANLGAEGFSLAFMEAFAAGLPIVTTRLGGAGELIDESCGVLAEPGDVDAVASGLKALIENELLRRDMSGVCRQRVMERCDPQTQLARLSNIIIESTQARLASTAAS